MDSLMGGREPNDGYDTGQNDSATGGRGGKHPGARITKKRESAKPCLSEAQGEEVSAAVSGRGRGTGRGGWRGTGGVQGRGRGGGGRRGGGGQGAAIRKNGEQGAAGIQEGWRGSEHAEGRWGGGQSVDRRGGRVEGRWGGGQSVDRRGGRVEGRWGGGQSVDRRGGRVEGRWGEGQSVDRRGGREEGRGGRRRDGPRDRQEKKEGGVKPRGNGLGFKTLEELSEKEPSMVAITLSTKPALHEVLGETQMRQDLVELLCLVMSKAFKSRTNRGTLQHLAGIIKDSNFFRTVLPHYLVGMGSESNPVRRERYPLQLENILAILSEVLGIFPASSVPTVSLLVTQIQASINSLKASEVDIQPQVEQSLGGLQNLIQHLQEKSREGTLRSDREAYSLLTNGATNPDEEDLEDFRMIPIYPTHEELHKGERPFLRPNLTSQRYTNTHVYLDTHFRLLREDFVRPLREGIQQLLWNQRQMEGNENTLKGKQFDDIRVYFDTKIVVPKCTHTGISHVVQFDVEPLKFVRWENTKRLIFGSLVCLSCDNFDTFLFATVSDRDPTTLKNGYVQISFAEESRLKLATLEKSELFIMVETTAYFEAYRYVLEGLQEQREDNLPFQRYIVECSPEVQPPAYLQRGDIYDLAAITQAKPLRQIRPFHSLKPEAWPKMEKLGLDESQMRAFQLAITKELAIIQGPPGTGKTYVGLKIAQALLTNKQLWHDGADRAPMLVVCYTNHALDQFLEGIHSFLQRGIVRVGGRSSSEILKNFNLRELIHSRGPSETGHLRNAIHEIYNELEEDEKRIQAQIARIKCCQKGVLRDNILMKFIPVRLWTNLNQQPIYEDMGMWGQRNPSPILEWLYVSSLIFLQRETETTNGNEEPQAAAEMQFEEEDLIHIIEESAMIMTERIIEDDIDPRREREAQKKRNLEAAVREAEEMMFAMTLNVAETQPEQEKGVWEMQRVQRRRMMNHIKRQLADTSTMTRTEENAVFDIWTLDMRDRWRLYRSWVSRYRSELSQELVDLERAYQLTVDRLAEAKRHESLCVLKRAMVVGMTTTGAAKHRELLQEVRPRLVIVEEAAEVLEAHTITTLSEACQHLILIGDHQQLRPSATVYDLAKNFNLEMSMFERLVKMEIPFVRLDYQHRMRPEIARLLTPHIYSELENHPSVFKYDKVKGLNTNLFFVEHNHLEENIKDGKSHKNMHEAKFVVALCRYFLCQDYKPEQITILTTYTGQLQCLRNLMPHREFTGVKVHVVDKYQGEENDIVLLSLVRSNKQGKVGFLNIPNRVCVALSRAKKGLFCICNSEMLGQVKLWSNIFRTLKEKGQIGDALTLCCPNHQDRQVQASCAEDFRQAPEGGCLVPCEFRLNCGHVCTRVCHPYDPEHEKFMCIKKCQKTICELEHKCPLLCHEKCLEKCPVAIGKVIPMCQHTQLVPCHQDPTTFVCKMPCQKLLPCGHQCDSWCGVKCTTRCKVKVPLDLSCGHKTENACFYKTLQTEPECTVPCEHLLKCGHACCGKCTKCYQGRFHWPCFHKCDRVLICSHKCQEPCTRDCPPCRKQCENCCIHSKCKKLCGEPCAPCNEPCPWQCPHQSCSKLCHEPCDRPPCTEPCDKMLKCGHPCIGLCGDKCPTKCRTCDHEEVTEIFFGNEEDPDANFIQLEDCGHIIEYSAMDTYMGMDDNLQVNDGNEVAIKLKECPKCRTPIRKNMRYGSHINRSLVTIEMVKVKINGDQLDIENNKKALQKQFEDNLYSYSVLPVTAYMHIHEKLGSKNLSTQDLWVLENKMDFLIRIAKLKKIQMKQLSHKQGSRLELQTEEFVSWLSNRHQKFTDQQVFDLQRELQKLSHMTELEVRCDIAQTKGQSDQIKSEVREIRELLEKSGQFTEQNESRVKDLMTKLDKKVPPTGLMISEEERKMIVSAMKMRQGHWYKCPNGHVYLITECGGAMESRRCPDCNAIIGGGNHALATGNQVASEMDGAQHAAWSEANNLLNFDEFV